MEGLGAAIKIQREKLGISQTELALNIGKSSQLICDIEAGRKNPSVDTLALIASEIDMSIDQFFLRDNYASGVKRKNLTPKHPKRS